jgi:hypothetical protein
MIRARIVEQEKPDLHNQMQIALRSKESKTAHHFPPL